MAPFIPPELIQPVARIGGISLLAGGITFGLATVFRIYGRTKLPTGLSLLAGLGVVALYLNTTAALGQAIGAAEGLLDLTAVIANVVTFIVASGAAIVGAQLGDRFGQVVAAGAGSRAFDSEVNRIVTSAGRAIAVELPREIADLEGYDPEPESVKATLSGKTLLFPRRLTVAELRNRLVTRLKEDYGVGHVNLELDPDGFVSYLGIGSRAAGLGPSLPPETVATAIRADPPFTSSSGDVVQVWSQDLKPQHLATGEFRARKGDVVTLAVDKQDASALDPNERYRLVTVPRDDKADTEFAGLLRVADVSFGEVKISSSSDLIEVPVGALDATIVAVKSSGCTIDVIPSQERTLEAGDRVYFIAPPKIHKRFEETANW